MSGAGKRLRLIRRKGCHLLQGRCRLELVRDHGETTLYKGWQPLFAIRPGVNKVMEEKAEAQGLRLRSKAGDICEEFFDLTQDEVRSLTTISDAAENLDWFRAKKAWQVCNQNKTRLCNAAMHAAFRCGNYCDGVEIYRKTCDRNTPKSAITYTCAMRLFAKARTTNEVNKLWQEAERQFTSWKPQQVYLLMNEMVNTMADAGNVTGMAIYLGYLEDAGFAIDEGTWGSALNGCKIAAEPGVADFLLKHMSRVNVSANLIHLKLAMGAHGGGSLKPIRSTAESAAALGIDEYFVEMHATSLVGTYAETFGTQNLRDARRSESKPPRRAEALQVIDKALASGLKLTQLTKRFHKALTEHRSD